MEENLQEDERRNLLNLYFNAWKDLHLSHMLEQRTETAALVYYSVNLKTKTFSAWNKILEDNRRYRSAALVIQAKSNLALKRKVFKGIDIIVKRRDIEDQFVAKLVMMYIKGLYRKSFEGWKEVTQESLIEQEKTLTALLYWKNNMLKKFFYLLRNWKSFVRPKSEREYEQNLLTRIMWRKIFIGKLRNSLMKKRKLYSDLGRAFGFRDQLYVKKAISGWKEYMEDRKYKKSIKPIYDVFVQGRNEKILRAYYTEWRRELVSEQEKERILEELIEGEWAVRSQLNSKKRAIGMIRDVITKKNEYYRGIWEKGVLKKVFNGWKGIQKMSNKHKRIYKEMRMKVIKRYFRKLKEYQDECKVKDGRKMTADRFYRNHAKERLFGIWRKKFLWIEHSRNVEEVTVKRRILIEKKKIFVEWRKIVQRKIELREKEDIIRDNKVKKAWKELYRNYQDGRRKDEMNRIVRRFRYFRLLKLALKGLRDSVRLRYLKLEGEDKALHFERQYVLGKCWKNWMKYLRQRAEKREERAREMKIVDGKVLKKVLREWRIQAEERRERRNQEKESRKYYEMGVLKKVMRRWKIFSSIRQEKRGYGRELEGIIRMTLGFRRFKKRALEMAKDRKAIQKSVTKLTLLRKASYFGEFYKKVQMNKRLRELKERAENYGEFYLKKKAFIGFILNRKMNRRERKANQIALEQWCYYRYKMVLKKFQEFIEYEKRRRDEEIQALEMKKEHIRKEVFSKLLEKGLELRDREFKKKVKSKIMSDMKEYSLMRKYAMKWLDFYYKRTGRIRGGQTLKKTQRTPVRSPIMNKSTALSMRDLEKEKSITLDRKFKQVSPIKKTIEQKKPKKLAAELQPKPRAEPRGRKIEQEDELKENEGLRSNLGGSTRLRTSSKGAEKQIMDWFETKRNERKQPKRAPVNGENRGNESMMISRDFMLSPFEKSNIREERIHTTHNRDLFESISPREEIMEIVEEVTQEDLDEKVHTLEGMLNEMKRSKERLLVLKERRDAGDRNEISMITKVLEVQKKDAKELLNDIRRMKEILGVE